MPCLESAASRTTPPSVYARPQTSSATPRASARALAANRSEIIAVTAPLHKDTDPAAHMVFAMEVTIAARQHDYDTLSLVHDDALEGMKRSASTALTDGIIVLDVVPHDDRANLARKLSYPTVFIGAR